MHTFIGRNKDTTFLFNGDMSGEVLIPARNIELSDDGMFAKIDGEDLRQFAKSIFLSEAIATLEQMGRN